MKIALCLYGRYNNRLSPVSGRDGTQYIKETVLTPYPNTDVFIYSTDREHQAEIEQSYQGFIKKAVFEPQKNFDADMALHGLQAASFKPPEGEAFRDLSNSLAFFYNRGQAIQLKHAYEQEHGFTYDWVIVCRFDLGQMDKYNGWHPYRVSEMNFHPHFDRRYLYSAMWNQLNCGYADQWFFSNSATIDILATMYEKVLGYLEPQSAYLRTIANGLPDSNAENIFSNECLKPPAQKTSQLVSYRPCEALNNHLLHKWFFMDNGLYEQSRFVNAIDNVCNFMYTHRDYKDVWPLYFGEMSKYFLAFRHNYVFVNAYSPEIPPYYTQIIYNETLSYTDRLLQCLEQLPSHFEICFYAHEDMFLYDYPDMSAFRKYVNAMCIHTGFFRKRPRYDFIRMGQGGDFIATPSALSADLHELDLKSKWIFSIQPSLWNIKRLKTLLGHHRGCSIWDFEEAAQATCRKKMHIRGAFSYQKGAKRGLYHWDNSAYPYVATAIVKGKWNTGEYPELQKTLVQYDVDVQNRGVYSP